jgi:hypothetical protein
MRNDKRRSFDGINQLPDRRQTLPYRIMEGLPVIRPRSANPVRHIVTSLAVHIRAGLPRRFSELAVFDARLYIRVRRIDEPAQLCGVCGRSRSQLHMAHELAGALQQARRIPQRCPVKEPHILRAK